ncbi:MAG: GNAT family N-acetyltransferase [Actinobacteria bacterium]|nr:GNAT family N-acetyltransferase [Actinomycetota bacterium]
MTGFRIEADDPASEDVRALLEGHLSLMRDTSPPEDVHALDVADLREKGVSFFSLRMDGELLSVGALKHLDPTHSELKSMHTAPAARRRGVARAMLEHLVGTARARGYQRVSVETGSMEAFAPARALYASAGFQVCEPFGDYVSSPNSVFMTLNLDGSLVTRAHP